MRRTRSLRPAAGRSRAVAAAALVAVVGLSVVALSGCASGSTGTGGAGSPQASTSPSPISRPTMAAREAKRILATFSPPAGARRLAARPAGASLLGQPPIGVPVTPNRVQDVQWWSVTGDPRSVAAAISTPPGAHSDGTSDVGDRSGTAYGVAFSWPSGPVLDTRQLAVGTAGSGGVTVIRVDAVVTWLPPRPANSLVPATATSITVTYLSGFPHIVDARPKPLPPVTTNDPATVAAVVAAVNRQPMQQLGPYRCPADLGRQMTIAFFDRGGTMIAKATIRDSGCATGVVTVTGGGKATIGDGHTLVTTVAALVHLALPAPR